MMHSGRSEFLAKITEESKDSSNINNSLSDGRQEQKDEKKSSFKDEKVEKQDQQEVQKQVFTLQPPNGNLTRDQMKKKPINLQNIVEAFRDAKEKIKHIEGKEIVVAVGDTGCGKTTLLRALIWGPTKLKQQKIERKQVITSTVKQDQFQIGHSGAVSQTFIPESYEL